MATYQQLKALEEKLRRAIGPECDPIREQIRQVARELGFGVNIMSMSEAVDGHKPIQEHPIVVKGDGEHVLITLYQGFQILMHVVDDPVLLGNDTGSKIRKWWKRRLPAHQTHKLVVETESWLKRRAAKRRQLRDVA